MPHTAPAARLVAASIWKLHNEVVFTPGIEGARDRLESVRNQAKRCIRTIDPRRDPLHYISALSPVMALDLLAGEPSCALARGLRGWQVLEEHEGSSRYVAERQHVLYRSIALAYHNLGDEQNALVWYDEDERQLQQARINTTDRRHWLADNARNRLLSLAQLPRIPIKEARHLADNASETFDRIKNPLAVFLTHEHRARIAIAQFNTRHTPRSLSLAVQSLEAAQGQLEQIDDAGPDHQAALMISTTRLHHVSGDRDMWSKCFVNTLALTEQAGLAHRRAKLLGEYRDASHAR